MREFSLTYEVDKLKKILRLPITNIVFDDKYEYGKLYLDENNDLVIIYGKLYINDELIGTMPYISDRWGPGYLNDKADLAWDKIYGLFSDVIFNKIVQMEPLAVTAEIAHDQIKRYGSLTLFIRDKDGKQINTALCNCVKGEWNIVLIGLNPLTKTIVFSTKITPPPLPPGIGGEKYLNDTGII